MSYVYFIESTNGSTYIGATVNLDKRIDLELYMLC
jgi:predicted GIY-YIG superfamily endonuclease